MQMKWFVGLSLVMVVACGPIASVLDPPAVVPSVELSRYLGKWYEIAHYPTFFQAGCASSIAEYSLNADGTVGVFNSCLAGDGSVVETIQGTARVIDPVTNAKLVVTFPVAPFPGPYWIIDLGENYEYAVVGDPTRVSLFILSRTPTLEQGVLDGILGRLVEQGYDPARLIYDTPVVSQ
jgi:apolipoprotein D and lipocalin family protein